jgi:hypothetical protein
MDFALFDSFGINVTDTRPNNRLSEVQITISEQGIYSLTLAAPEGNGVFFLAYIAPYNGAAILANDNPYYEMRSEVRASPIRSFSHPSRTVSPVAVIPNAIGPLDSEFILEVPPFFALAIPLIEFYIT